MVLRHIVGVATCAVLVSGTAALAADYRPGEFLNLDLSKAVLSPRPLGPEAHFEPVPVEARTDRTIVATRPTLDSQVSTVAPHPVATPRVHSTNTAERTRGEARTKLAHRRGNPMDAQAMDTRVHTWPCRPGSGGICSWR